MTKYKHTQVGYLIIYTTIVIAVFYAWMVYFIPHDHLRLPIIIIMLAVILLLASFSTLTVTIDEKYLRVSFGYGIFARRFPLSEIASAKAVKNHWYYGWGIKWWFWPKMTIYSVSGFDAVEIVLKNGSIYRIGTDTPQELERAINIAINS